MQKENVIIQGELGCFHEEAASAYFQNQEVKFVPARSFDAQAAILSENPNTHLAVMAIENSIAGSILQNYRILREHRFEIIGEVYLRIVHNLMAMPGQKIEDLREVHSHPMALYQCLGQLSAYDMRPVETEDTALSARKIKEGGLSGIAAIASARAAEIHGLEILAAGIESSKLNYTRFFILEASRSEARKEDFDKASIYLRVLHKTGRLLSVLQVLDKEDVNLTKLQSYPVLGEPDEYYFHMDLEFESSQQFYRVLENLVACTQSVDVLGTFKKATRV